MGKHVSPNFQSHQFVQVSNFLEILFSHASWYSKPFFRTFGLNCYVNKVGMNWNCKEYRIPARTNGIFQEVWLLLTNISKYAYMNWKQLSLAQWIVLAAGHGLTGYKSNSAKLVSRQSVRRFVRDIAGSDGHPLPVRLYKSDGRSVTIVVLVSNSFGRSTGSQAPAWLIPRMKQVDRAVSVA